jgi:hypothetical protein
MTDDPRPRCVECGNVGCACTCSDGRCTGCGEMLDKDELAAGRDECWLCYLHRHDD